jgi:SAM-dependent methyltransferase
VEAKPTAMPGNADQVEFWNGPGGARWVKHQETLDRALEPFGRAVVDAARLESGERVVDVGCGCGWTALAVAQEVGAEGGVLGVDVSAPMLALARARALARGLANATFALGDASEYPFEPAFDLLLSRFGVMFFRDPTDAFANLRRALRPGGRVAFVCWGPVADNPWFRVPIAAAGTVVPLPEPPAPEEPGPFSFADRARVERVLQGAGFVELAIDRSAPDYVLGPDLDTAATNAVETGPVSRLLSDADEEARASVRVAIRAALAPHLGARGVALAASTWVVRARTSA